MSRINAHRRWRGRGGFTFVELLVAAGLSLIVAGGVLSAYLFMGRNLTRMVNLQQQEVKGRRALRMFTQDLSSAIQLTTSTDTVVAMTVPVGVTLTSCSTTLGSTTVTCSSTASLAATSSISGSGIPTGATVSSITNGTTFVLSANATATASGLTLSAIVSGTATFTYDSSGRTLVRTYQPFGGATTTTTLLTDLSSFDFNYYNEAGTAVTSSPQSVKSVEFTYTSTVGTSFIGTQVSHTTVSPRVVLRNKPLLN